MLKFRVFLLAFLGVLLVNLLLPVELKAQCPTVLALGSNQTPDRLCSPVTVQIDYNVSFSVATQPTDIVRIRFVWGDGSNSNNFIVPGGLSTYNQSASHTYPNDSDCEYTAQVFVLIDDGSGNTVCTSTIQEQVITTWRTDEFNGGNIQLISPVSGTNIEEVCEGVDVDVIFNDLSEWNCNIDIDPDPLIPKTPNEDVRWQQIVYNTKTTAGNRIPNVRVDGVLVTDGTGADVISDYQDPRGVFEMTAPVVVGDPRRRPTLQITAPGGFGTGFPQDNDIFEVTIRNWNFCNPYDDPNIPGPPADLINGDFAPIESIALIEIIDSPDPPGFNPDPPIFCQGRGNGAYNLTANGAGGTYRWYSDPALTNLLKTGNNFNPITEGGVNKNPAVPTTTNFYLTEEGALTCVSDATVIPFTIHTNMDGGDIDHPLGTSPTAVCSGDDPASFTNGASASGGDGVTYNYQWQQSTTGSGSGFGDIGGATGLTYDPGALTQTTWFRRRVRSDSYSIAGNCDQAFSNVYEIRVDQPVVGGSIGNAQTICTGDDPNGITNTGSPSGGSGTFVYQWESSTVGASGPFSTIGGASSITYNPPVLVTTTWYRRVAISGVCVPNFDYSNVIEITVDQVVNPGSIGNAQSICNGDNPGIISEISGPSGGDGVTYVFQWEESATGGGAGFSAAPGINNLATYDPPVLTATRFYRRRVTSGACPDAFTNEIEITINPLPEVTAETGGGAVCAGFPAPDIVFTLTGRPPFDITYEVTKNGGPTTFGPFNVNNYTPPEGAPPYTFTITSPDPLTDFDGTATGGDSYDYNIIILDDKVDTSDPSCTAANLGGSVNVSIGGTPPSVDPPGPILVPTSACDDGGSTSDPELQFSLDDAGSANQSGFTLSYEVNGSSTRTIFFDTDATGDPDAPILFTDAELDAAGAHTITLLSLLSPSGCLSTFSIPLNFTVVPRPGAPTGPVNNSVCSDVIGTATVEVDAPGAGFRIDWYNANSGGSLLATGSEVFDPAPANEPAAGATATYYAEIVETGSGLGCQGTARTAVTLTSDALPSSAVADADANPTNNTTCNVTYIMDAVPADNGGTGTWSTAEPGVSYSNINDAAATITFDNASLPAPNGSPRTVTFTWTISSALGLCTDSQDNVDIIINPLPEANDAFPGDICADNPIVQQNSNIDLTSYNDNVTGVALSPDRIIRWYDDAIYTSEITGGSLTAYTVTDGLTLYTEVEFITTGCTNRGVFNFTVNPMPTLTAATGEGCEDALGALQVSGVDLTTFNNTVTGGAANRTVEWYRGATYDPSDLIDPVNGLDDTSYDIIAVDHATPTTIYARIYDTSFPTLCFNDTQLDYTVNPLPAPNPIRIPDGSTPASATFCRSNDLIVLQVLSDNPSAEVGPGDVNYTWNVPTGAGEFELLSSGTDFFVLVRFPNPVPGGLNITVFETTDPEGCNGVLNTLTVFVEDTPPKPVIDDPGVVCENDSETISIQTPTAGSTYTWAVTAGDASIVGLPTGPSILVNFGVFNSTIEVVETNASGCTAPPADPLVVNMSPRPTLDPNQDVDVCSDSPIGLVMSSDVAPSDRKFNITNVLIPPGLSPDVGNVANSGYTSTSPFDDDVFLQNETFTNLTGGPLTVEYTVEPVNGSTGCTGISEIIRATIYPEASLAPNLDATQCSDVASGITLGVAAGSAAADYYIIDNIDIQGVLTEDPGNNVSTSSTFPISTEFEANPEDFLSNERFTNLSNASVTVVYSVRAASSYLGGTLVCIGAPAFDINFIVNPEPILADALENPVTPFERCSDEALNITLATEAGSVPVPATNGYEIVAINPNGLTASAGTPIPIAGVGVDEIEDDAWTNTTGSPVTVTYTVRGTSSSGNGSCQSETIDIDIIINSAPNGFNDTSPTACSSDFTFSYDLQTNVNDLGNGGNGVASTFQWIATDNPNVSGESTTTQTTAAIDDDLINISGSDQIVQYTVTPTSVAGTCTGPSFTVDVTVYTEPVGFTDTDLTCSDNGTYSYDLQNNVNDLTNGGNGVNSTFSWVAADNPDVDNESLVPVNTAFIDDALTNNSNTVQTVNYTVTPTSQAQSCQGQDFVVGVQVEPIPVADVTPANQVVCNGDNVNINITTPTIPSVPADLSFDLTVSSTDAGATGGAAFTDLTSQTFPLNITGDLTNSSTDFVTVTFEITPKYDGCTDGTPITVTVEVEPDPVIASTSTNETICSSDAINITLSSPNTVTTPASLLFDLDRTSTDDGNLSGTAPDDLLNQALPFNLNGTFVNSSDDLITVTYTATPKYGTCGTGAPIIITIEVEPTPTLAVTPPTQTVCDGGNVNIQVTSPTNPSVPADLLFDVNVTSSNDPALGGAASVNLNDQSFPLNITGDLTNSSSSVITVTYEFTPKYQACVAGPTESLTVLVEPTPQADVTPLTQTICNNGNVAINISTTTTTTTPADQLFDVVVSSTDDPNLGGAASVDLTDQSFPFTINGDLTNSSNSVITVTYDIIPKYQTCNNGTTQSVSVVLEPSPAASLALVTPAVICDGENVRIDVTTPTTPTNAGLLLYDWSVTGVPVNPGGTASLGATDRPFGTSILGNLTNTGNVPIVATFTITPKYTGCPVGPDQTIDVTVNPTPVGSADNSVESCSGDLITYDINTDNIVALGNGVLSEFTYTVTSSNSVATPPEANRTVASNAPISQSYVNESGSDVLITYLITPISDAGGCTGIPFTVEFTIHSEPVGGATTETAQCSDVAFDFDPQTYITNGMTNNSFTWTVVSYDPGLTVVAPGTGVGNVAETLRNTSPFTLNAIYEITPTDITNSCVGDPFQIVVPVQPEPVGSSKTVGDVCSNVQFSRDLQTDIINGLTSDFTWVVQGGTYPVGITVTSAGTGTGLLEETLENLTNSPINVTYEVTPLANPSGCPGDVFTITIPINPEPVGTPTTFADQCSDIAFSINPQDYVANRTATFTWTANYNGLTGPANGVNNISMSIENTTGSTVNVEYTVTPTDAAFSCVGSDFVITVPILSEPDFVVPAQAPVCSDVTLNIDPQSFIDNGMTGNSFTWTASYPVGLQNGSANGTGVITETITNQTASQLTATFTVTPTNTGNGCVGDPFDIDVPIDPEPAGNSNTKAEVCSGVQFSHDPQNDLTNGMASTFTWQVQGGTYPVGISVITPGSGTGVLEETLENLTNNPINVLYEITPTAVGTNCVGDIFILTIPVNPEPVGTPTTFADQCSDVAFNINPQDYVANRSANFTWIANYNGLTGPANGVGNISMSIENLTGSTVNVEFTVTPTDAAEACVGEDFIITVPILSEPDFTVPVIPATCSDVALNIDPQSFVNNGMAGNTFTWTATYPTGLSGGAASGSNTITETITNESASQLTATFTVIPTNTGNGCVGDPFDIDVPIDPEPVGTDSTTPAVCSDEAFNIDPQDNIINGLIAGYTWTATYDAGITGPASGSGSITGLSIENRDGAIRNAMFTFTPTDVVNSCLGDPFTITVPIDPEPAGTDATKTVVCSGVAFDFDPQDDTDIPASYTWTAIYNGSLSGGAGSGSGNINETLINVSGIQLNAVYTVIPTSTADGCVGNTFEITVPIDPAPVMNIPPTAEVCSDNIVNVTLDVLGSSIAATDYDIRLISQDAGLTGTPTTGNNLAATSIENDSYTNITAAPLTVAYGITPNGTNGCQGEEATLTVTVNPEPVVADGLDVTVCSDESVGIIFTTNGTSIGATLYNLISVSVSQVGNVIPQNNVTADYIQNDRFTNATSAQITVDYVIEPISPDGCVGDQKTITVTVNPEPEVGPTTADLCSDVPSGIVLSSANGVPITTYQLNAVTVPPGLTAGGSNAGLGSTGSANFLANDVYTNTADVPLDVTYKVIGISPDNCAGDEQDIVFTVQPAPAMSDNLDNKVCSNEVTGVVLAVKTLTAADQYEIVAIDDTGLNVVTQASLGLTNDPNVISNDEYINNTNNPLDVTYTVRPISAAGCIGPNKDIIITVEPLVILATNNTTTNICSSTVTSIELTSPTIPTAGGITFTVTASDDGAPGEVFGYAPFLSFLPNGHVIQDNLINLSNTPKTVTYDITANAVGANDGLGCNSAVTQETVVIEPKPILTPAETFATVCEGIEKQILLESNTVFSSGGVEFEIINVVPNGISGFSPIGTTYANNTNLAETLTNPTSVPTIIEYTLRPQSDSGLGCEGDPVTISLTVNPTPTATIAGDATICSEGFATVQFQFTGRLPYTMVYNDGTGDITLNNLGPVHFITQQFTETTTFTLVSVTDANGCVAGSLGDQVTITVEDAVADPSIAGVSSGCSPLEVTFNNNDVRPGVTYEWNWGDGTPSTITSDATVTHVFNNASTFTSLTYNVTLFATNDAQGCLDTESLTVEVLPTILPNILPSTLEGCAPLTVSFLNNTLGAAEHEWFYREKGTTDQLEVVTTPLVTYELPNQTPNTIVYEVVYIASKDGCSEEVITDVTVYPELAPSFTISENPIEVNENDGTATITVTNTTLNKNAWTYEWSWGDGETTTAVDPGSHTYQQYGEYEITVRILFDGGVCEATTSEILVVEPIFPDVNFEADILEGCRPLTVNFTNLSVATDPNSFSWEIVNVQSGNVIATSNQENFTYEFNDAGTYTVVLSGSNPLGIVDTETKDNYIKVNENPVASFSVRPSIVYLPDGVVFTQNLSSRADKFFWDFNANDPNDAGQANGEEDLVSELFEPEVVYNYRGFKDIMLVAELTETGCRDTLIVEQAVFVDQGGETRVPNAFSPNPDGPTGGTGGSGGEGGFNDNFLPFVQGVSPEPGSFHMQIFDRWGNLVFESWDQNVGWDGYDDNGKLMPMGVYVYRLDLRFVDGNTSIRIGDVTLVR